METNYTTMKRPELRKACKAAGIKYGKLTVGGMRDTLQSRVNQVPKKVFGGNSVADEVAELEAADKENGLVAGMGDLLPEREVAENPTPPAKPGTGLKIEKDREERNGIKRPSVGGRCRAIWDTLDSRQAEGEAPTAKSVKIMAETMGWNPNNASIEFYQWRKFNNITGRAKKA